MKDPNEGRAGYEETKTGWIPLEWCAKPLGVLGSFSRGRGIPNEEKRSEGLPCITYGDIYTKYDVTVSECSSFVDEHAAARSQPISRGCILFAGSGETLDEIGKCVAYESDEEAYAGGDIIIFSPRACDSVYLSNFLNSNRLLGQRRRLGQGHSVVHIYAAGLQTLMIPLPLLPEQEEIADILSTWDRAIEQTGSRIITKGQQRKALMQQLLGGKTRLPGFSDEWQSVPLAHVLEPISRPVPRPSTPYTAIGLRCHGKGTFHRYVPDPSKVKMDTLYRIEPGDLVVNITFAWEGAIAIASKDDAGGLVSHRFPSYHIKGASCVEFMRFLIKTDRLVWDLGLISPGGAGRNRVMNKTDLLKIRISIPTIAEQRAIADVLQTVDSQIALLGAKHEALKVQKKGLMQKLLTGQIRVKV